MNREHVVFVSVLTILTVALSFFVIKNELPPPVDVPVSVHDVSIVSVVVTQNYDVIALAGNGGNQVENFSVTVCCNGTVIGNQTVSARACSTEQPTKSTYVVLSRLDT